MKTKSIRFSSILLVILLGSFTAVSAQSRQKNAKSQKVRRNSKIENIQLFNGKDLSNWLFYLKDQSVDPASVFTVQNGVIHITGNPFGYMRTKDTYSDYRLHVEWRYPVEATNSGVFIHATPPDAIWIKCFECQLAARNAGDFICMNGTDMNERKDKTKGVVKKLAASSEKSVGEWNIMEVVARENTLEVFINGVQQNKGTAISSTSGHICLQSEGKDIEFKNVYLTNLKKSGRR
jgi:Domain of Unknown Function (DUF1080)